MISVGQIALMKKHGFKSSSFTFLS